MTIVTELAKVIKNCIHAESSVFCKFISISNIFLSASINMKEKLTSAEADFMPGSSSGPVASKVIKSNQEGISKPVKIDISRDIQGLFKGHSRDIKYTKSNQEARRNIDKIKSNYEGSSKPTEKKKQFWLWYS